MTKNCRILKILILTLVSSILFITFAPVYKLSLYTKDREIFSAVIPSGTRFSMGYVHSVEQTPVEDIYVVSGPQLWLWEERFRSHNAGLPTEAPLRSHFFMEKDWMIIRGSTYRWEQLAVRIGNKELGRNWISSEIIGKVNLFEIVPDRVLYLKITQSPLFFKKESSLL
ncbi:DUF1850 domain-containing protein [Aminobacterium mobile]|uniref:DUF1850 domain-containing protein n=1 Tax=Aminobacterium mobile TaxID=81467 RepID=UPI00331544A4